MSGLDELVRGPIAGLLFRLLMREASTHLRNGHVPPSWVSELGQMLADAAGSAVDGGAVGRLESMRVSQREPYGVPVEVAAGAVELSPRRVREFAQRGSVRAWKVSRVWLIDLDSLNNYLRSRND